MAWIPYAELGTSLLGSIKGGKGQQAAGNAASQAFTAEEQAIASLMSQYFQNAPQFLSTGYGLIDQLKNFPQMQAPEIQNLVNQLSSSNASTLGTLKSNLGGIANPNATLASLQGANLQNQAQAGEAMQSQLAGQDLQAMGMQGNVLADIGSFLSAPVGAGLQGLQGIGSTYANAASQAGNPFSSLVGALGNFANGKGSAGPSTATGGLTTGSGPNAWIPGIQGAGGAPLAPMNLPQLQADAPTLGGIFATNTNPYQQQQQDQRFAPPLMYPGALPTGQ